jgi:cell division topological specificity factor
MSGLFDKMLGRNKDSSAQVAKERLQLVLVHDRINLPPERLREMKAEIIAVISKYVAVTNEGVEVILEQRDREDSRLIAEIPFSKSLLTDTDGDSPAADHEESREIHLDDDYTDEREEGTGT